MKTKTTTTKTTTTKTKTMKPAKIKTTIRKDTKTFASSLMRMFS